MLCDNERMLFSMIETIDYRDEHFYLYQWFSSGENNVFIHVMKTLFSSLMLYDNDRIFVFNMSAMIDCSYEHLFFAVVLIRWKHCFSACDENTVFINDMWWKHCFHLWCFVIMFRWKHCFQPWCFVIKIDSRDEHFYLYQWFSLGEKTVFIHLI